MTISQFIADKINYRLKALKISKGEFAAMVGIAPTVVSRWLSGTHNFTIDTLEKIQAALRISFFTYSEDNKPCAPCIVTKLTASNENQS